jgi:hypothetical protein
MAQHRVTRNGSASVAIPLNLVSGPISPTSRRLVSRWHTGSHRTHSLALYSDRVSIPFHPVAVSNLYGLLGVIHRSRTACIYFLVFLFFSLLLSVMLASRFDVGRIPFLGLCMVWRTPPGHKLCLAHHLPAVAISFGPPACCSLNPILSMAAYAGRPWTA